MNILRLSALLLFTMMLIPIGASAHCKGKHDVEGHEHCGPGGVDPADSTYRVVIGGDVMGASINEYPWHDGGRKKSIGGQQHKAGDLTDLSIFESIFDTMVGDPPATQGAVCFPPVLIFG